MKIIRSICIGILCVVLVLAGYVFFQYKDVWGINIVAPSPQEYAKQAILFMDQQGIYNTNEEWMTVMKEVLEETKDCQSYEETYPYLEKALKQVGGKHSRLIPSDEVDSTLSAQFPTVEMIEDIAYIQLPEFSGDVEQCATYVNTVIDFLDEQKEDIHGAIIDLRHNTGGDMGPMVASVSPFLPDGEVLAFDCHGFIQSVTLNDGTVTGGGTSLSVPSFKFENVKVAILQDELCASSAEATLLTFRGLEYVKTFGQASAGYCSCNTTKKLYDGSVMLLTIGYDLTRTGERFSEDPIEPDYVCDNPKEEAILWLES